MRHYFERVTLKFIKLFFMIFCNTSFRLLFRNISLLYIFMHFSSCSLCLIYLIQRLAICAATVMFTLSQDRLNMDLDRDSLELMLNLLDTDADASDNTLVDMAEVDHNKKKIRELCRDMQKKGHAKHLNLNNITVSLP